MRLAGTCVLRLSLACLPGLTPSTSAQIIISDEYFASNSQLPAPSPAQLLAPRLADLSAHPDGTARLAIPHGFSHAANPFEQSADLNLFSADIRWHSGSFHPLETDLELPTRGLSWPIGRSFNANQFINNNHHISHGPQGENWAQSSMPELLSADNDRILLIAWGADRLSAFARVDPASDTTTTIYRGVQGSAGTIEHLHAHPDLFRFTDPRGFQAVFFGDQSDVPRRLWYLSDPGGRTSFVGSMQSQEIAASSGYGSDGLIDFATDAAGRHYNYRYSTDPIGDARRLLDVTVMLRSQVVATVAYDYYSQQLTGAGRVGDLKTVTVTLPLSNSAEQVSYKKHYRYWTDTWSPTNPGHPHSIRMVIEPEGFRRAVMDGLDPDVVVDSASLDRYADLRLEYDESRRISAVYDIKLATSELAGGIPLAERNTVEYETNIGARLHNRTIIRADGHYTTLYFDPQGQQLSAIKSVHHPAQSSTYKIYEIERDASGSVIYRGTPQAANAYRHASGEITRRAG